MMMKLRNQPYAPKWEQEEREKLYVKKIVEMEEANIFFLETHGIK
jgi:hypothetical protein